MEFVDWKLYTGAGIGVLAAVLGFMLATSIVRKVVVGVILGLLAFVVVYGVLLLLHFLWDLVQGQRSAETS